MPVGVRGLDQQRSDINVTPLIDVLLVLLVMFMILTPLLTKALDSSIPKKSDQPLPREYADKQLVLTITEDGRFLLNTEELGLATLTSRLRDVFTQRGGGRVVFVNPQDGVPYGSVVQAMDLCWSADAENVGIVTEPLDAAEPVP